MNQSINHGVHHRVDKLQRLRIYIVVMMCLAGLLFILTIHFMGIRLGYPIAILGVLIAILGLLGMSYPTKKEMLEASAADFDDGIKLHRKPFDLETPMTQHDADVLNKLYK